MKSRNSSYLWIIIPLSIFFVMLLGGIYVGWIMEKSNLSQTAVTQNLKISNTPPIKERINTVNSKADRIIPDSPPDLVSDEEECVGKFMGVPEPEYDSNGNMLPTPKHMAASSCRKTRLESSLSFEYPCNFEVVAVVEKEQSKTCGWIREYYILAGREQTGFLTVYPPKEDSVDNQAEFWREKYPECSATNIGKYKGYLCDDGYTFVSEHEDVLIVLNYRRLDYKKEIDEILSTLKLKY